MIEYREMVKCANPSCQKMIVFSSKDEYCSYKCKSEFSPVMRQVCEDNFIEKTPAALRSLLIDLVKEQKTNLDISIIFGVGTKTLRLWFKKLGI
jgi:hypothetical protein